MSAKKWPDVLLCLYIFVYPFISYFITYNHFTGIQGRRWTMRDRVINICLSATPGINVLKDVFTGIECISINWDKEVNW